MKKLLALICSVLMAFGCATVFTACGGNEEAGTVMNLSLNPEVEFILDVNNKVVSVNALNEEGNLIISIESFTGKTAEEAAQLFVKASKETGFLVEGNVKAGENEIKISLSGDSKKADDIYNGVKDKVEEYLSKENITAQIEKAAAITEEQLRALVAECAPYIDKAKLNALSQMEMIEELVASRKETIGLYSQQLKTAYYESKAFIIKQTEVETIKSHLSLLEKAAVEVVFGTYKLATQSIETLRASLLVNELSPYQVALKVFQGAKAEYLKYRNYVASLEQNAITSAISEQLATLQAGVESAEASLREAADSANQSLNSASDKVEEAYNAVISAISDYADLANEYATEISASVNTQTKAFFTQFENNYASAISSAKANWAEMKNALQA